MYTTVGIYYVVDYLKYLTESPFDPESFIIVGAGSGGSVVAGRLAEVGHNVILVEAGGHSPHLAHIPVLVGYNQLGPIDWQYRTEKQDDAGLAFDGVSMWPRGKVLGGSSMLNYMMYIRGHDGDYDEWADYGVEGWAWKDVLPFFKKSENFDGYLHENDQDYHGVGGPLTVQNETFAEPILAPFLAAGREKGYPTADPTGSGMDKSFSWIPASIAKGKRAGTYMAFADKYSNDNLRLVNQAQVIRVIFDNKKAVGIELERFGRKEIITTNKEIILSAGTIGTPQILMLSGVGDAKELSQHGIPLVQDTPLVGKNLQDHIFPHVPFKAPQTISKDARKLYALETVLDYLNNGKGPWTSIGGAAGSAFIHTAVNNDTRPDIQIILASFLWGLDHGLQLKHNIGMQDFAFDWYESHQINGIILAPVLSRPKSTGSIMLRSKDHNDHPIINANYLSSNEDLETLISAVEFCHDIVETDAFRKSDIELFAPYPPCARHKYRSRSYYECYVRHWVQTLYHPVGTAAMGSVLDSQLRVKGIENLRVADGAAMPKLIGGNTNAPIIMIGERAADFINKDWEKSSTTAKGVNAKTEL